MPADAPVIRTTFVMRTSAGCATVGQRAGAHDTATAVVLRGVGATNRPWDMDEATLRTSRFGERFYVSLPNAEARGQILHFNLDGIPMADDVDLADFANGLDGYSLLLSTNTESHRPKKQPSLGSSSNNDS